MTPDIALNEIALNIGGETAVVRISLRLLVHLEAEYQDGFIEPLNAIFQQMASGVIPSNDLSRFINCCLKSAGSKLDALDMSPVDAMEALGNIMNAIMRAMKPANPAVAADETKVETLPPSMSVA